MRCQTFFLGALASFLAINAHSPSRRSFVNTQITGSSAQVTIASSFDQVIQTYQYMSETMSQSTQLIYGTTDVETCFQYVSQMVQQVSYYAAAIGAGCECMAPSRTDLVVNQLEVWFLSVHYITTYISQHWSSYMYRFQSSFLALNQQFSLALSSVHAVGFSVENLVQVACQRHALNYAAMTSVNFHMTSFYRYTERVSTNADIFAVVKVHGPKFHRPRRYYGLLSPNYSPRTYRLPFFESLRLGQSKLPKSPYRFPNFDSKRPPTGLRNNQGSAS